MKIKLALSGVLILLVSIFSPSMAQNKVVLIPFESPLPPATRKTVFLTNGTWTGNLGGLAGADEKCNAEAKSRGIRGVFQAILGTIADRPHTRSIHYPLSYYAQRGAYLQSDFHDLFGPGPDNPVVTSSDVSLVWTGLFSDGTVDTAKTCLNWTSVHSSAFGRAGLNEQTGGAWISASSIACDFSLPLYCIEQ